MKRFNRHLVVILAGFLWTGLSSLGFAQQAYPTRPVELIVSFAAGGVTDQVARLFAAYASERLGQPVSVINRPGGGGVTGTLEAARASPNGYTLLMHVIGPGTLTPATQIDIPYDWDGFTFIARTNVTPVVFVVAASAPEATLDDLAAGIRQDPGIYNFATGAASGVSTFAAAQFLEAIEVDPRGVSAVVFDGGNPATLAVAGGHVRFAAQNLPEVLGLVEGERLRALAVTTDSRVDSLPDVPTTAELGMPSVTLMGWNGIAGPPGLPDEVVETWQQLVEDALGDEAFVARLIDLGVVPAYLGPEGFSAALEAEYLTLRAFAERLGLRE